MESEIQQAIPDRGCRQMVAEAEDLEVVDLAEGYVHWQRVPQIGIVSGVGSFVIRMHITGKPVLRMRQVDDVRVWRIRTRSRGVRISGIPRKQEMIFKVQKPDVSPIAGVKFLSVKKQCSRSGRRIGTRPEVGNVWNSLLLVDDQVFDDG